MIHKSGITFDGAWLIDSAFKDQGFAGFISGQPGEPDPELKGVELGAKVGVLVSATPNADGSLSALVTVRMAVRPKAQPTFTATVEFLAKFTRTQEATIEFEPFLWRIGVGYLIPYVRERLAGLTQASRYGTFHLDPIDVDELLRLAESTGGMGERPAAKQAKVVAEPASANLKQPASRRRRRTQ